MDTNTNTVTERKSYNFNINAKKIMPDLLWVLKAVSKDKNREILQNIFIESDGYMATDSKRLHICYDRESLPAIENGLYKVIITKDNVSFIPQDGEFPNCKIVIPADTENKLRLTIDDNSISISCAVIRIAHTILKDSNGVNYDFIADLVGETWEITGAPDKSVKFTSGKLLAIVMPIRL